MNGRRYVRWSLALGCFCLALSIVASPASAERSPVEDGFLQTPFDVSPAGLLGYPLLAYDQYGDPVTEVWVAKGDGSEPRRVASVPGMAGVQWLDADRLVALGCDRNEVSLLSLHGGEPKTLSVGNAFRFVYPSLSPRGNLVAFSAFRQEPRGSGVWALDLATGQVKPLSAEIVKSYPNCSPDGAKVAYGVGSYQRDYRLVIADVATGQASDTGLLGVGISWSPDGKWIAYTGNVARGGSWLNGLPRDGSILKTNLATKETVALTEPPVNKSDQATGAREMSGAFLPVWSPDGAHLAYRRAHSISSKKTGEAKSEDEIWVMAADGSGKQKVSATPGPAAWASDGKSLYFKGEKGITQYVLETGSRREVVAWTLPQAPELKASDFKHVTAEGAEVEYFGLPDAYAQAILTTAATARRIYAETLHADVPATVTATLRKSASERTSLWTDGISHFFLTLYSVDDLAPPRQSGYFHLYGICHELGHIAMYRRIRELGLPEGIGEGWAHYAGSVVVDEVYKQQGEKLWPVPYDYREDGTARLAKQVADPRDATEKAAAAFYQAGQRYGHATVFAAMNAASEGKPYGRDLMPRFVKALVKLTGDPAAAQRFPQELLTSQVKWETKERGITEETTKGEVTEKDATGVLLRYDSGHSDGMRSTSGSGHAVAFRCPAGAWAVDEVRMYGMRYGTTEPPKVNFTIYLCDRSFNIIKEIEQPYSKLSYGDKPEWNRFTFEPVAVPEAFYVCVYFDATYDRGFYVHFEKGHTPNHSYAALPLSFISEAKEGDWMIRVHLRPQ